MRGLGVQVPLEAPIWPCSLTDRTRGFHPRNEEFDSPQGYHAPLAHQEEHRTFNAGVPSSSLGRRTKTICGEVVQLVRIFV